MSALHASRKALLDATAGLSAKQAAFKAGPDRWSIADITEHLAITEPFLFGLIPSILKSPPDPSKKESVKANDAAILKNYANRDQKVQAPPPAKPSGKFASLNDSVAEFKLQRTKTITYVQTTGDALRDHFMDNFAGSGKPADAYQVLLMLAAHTDRHVAQINEVKASKGYPAK